MTEHQTTPELRFPEFKDNWKPIKLGTLLQETNIKQNQNTPLFSLTVENGLIEKIDRYNREFLVKKADAFKNVKPLNIVYNPMNITLGAIDLLSINKEVKVSGYYNVLEIKDQTNPKFLIETLKTYKSILLYKKVATGSLKEKQRVHFSEFKKLHKLFPSYTEQNKIGNFFSKLDRQIELEEEKLELLDQQKKGYMQKLFSQEVRFKDDRGNNYPDWQRVKIGDILEERTERSSEGDMLSVTINNGIIKFDEVDRKDNSSKDKSNYRKVYKNDIAYNSMRMWQGASGKSEYEGIVSPAYTVTVPIESINPDFIAYYFKIHKMIHKFKINSQGLTSDTWNLKYRQLKEIKINLCLKEEQNKIANLLITFDKLISRQKNKLEILKTNKKGLLQKMFI